MNVERVTIKYDGQYSEFQAGDLDMSPTNPSDAEATTAVIAQLDIDNLTGYVVDPPETERNSGQHDDKTVLNVRPTASYGSH